MLQEVKKNYIFVDDTVDKNEVVSETVSSDVEVTETEDEIVEQIFLQERETEQKVVDDLTADRDLYKNKYLYALAELENYKKRTVAEKPGLIESGEKKVLKEVINVVDDFERAIVANESVEDVNTLKEGFKLLYDKFNKTLSSLKVQKIESNGVKFDPMVHEAIATVPVVDEDSDKLNIVMDTLRTGYKYKDTVLRHPQVVVFSKKED